jgi:hypothetical protein
MNAQTSDRVSAIAARYVNMPAKKLAMMTTGEAGVVLADIRALAASCLAQDEYRGQRKKKAVG